MAVEGVERRRVRRQATDASAASNDVIVVDGEETTLFNVVVNVGHLGEQAQVNRLYLDQGSTGRGGHYRAEGTHYHESIRDDSG